MDMATSLISDSQKDTIKAIIDDIHETFARNITIFEEGERILLAVDDILIDGNILDRHGNTIDTTQTFFKNTAANEPIWTTDSSNPIDMISSAGTVPSIGVIGLIPSIMGSSPYWVLLYYDSGHNLLAQWTATYNGESAPIDLAFTPINGTGTPTARLLSNRSASNSKYNGVYGRIGGGATGTRRTSVSHTIKARIKYINAREQNLADGNINSQLDINLIDGSVRITVDASGFAILKEAKRCEFEGRKYTINSKGNPTGIFGPQYYHFYLSPIEA